MEEPRKDENESSEEAIEDLAPSDEESTQVAGGGKKLPGTQRPPTIT